MWAWASVTRPELLELFARPVELARGGFEREIVDRGIGKIDGLGFVLPASIALAADGQLVTRFSSRDAEAPDLVDLSAIEPDGLALSREEHEQRVGLLLAVYQHFGAIPLV